jgi:transcriptional regulator with XRE-family HTH domain
MNTRRDTIDLLLQLAFLEGKITTHGLYEQTVPKRKPLIRSADAAKAALAQKLEVAILSSRSRATLPLTLGTFLRGWRQHQSLRPQDVFSRLGISSNIYRMLERDRISPLKISLASWKKMRQFFQIPLNVLEDMIRRTHQLVYFRTSFRMTLARYDARKNKKMKAATLEKAAEELFARATLPLPQKEQEKLNAFLKALANDSV